MGNPHGRYRKLSKSIFLLTVSALMMGAMAAAAEPVLQVTDVSPDRPYGDPEDASGTDPSGRVITVVVDPVNSLNLYAATDLAGIWKSTDGAHTWQQASSGLLNPVSNGFDSSNSQTLAIDETNPLRLIYSTTNDDLRPGQPFGGLYVTIDGAETWRHVDLPGCPQPDAGSVAFGGGQAYVTTRCGIATSRDLNTWSVIETPFTSDNSRIAVAGLTLYACANTSVFRYTSGSWTAGPSLSATCFGLAVSPDDPRNQVLAAELGTSADVELVNFTTYSSVSLGLAALSPKLCCGALAVYTPRLPSVPPGGGPGLSYDVLVGAKYQFWQYVRGSPFGGPTWQLVNGVHFDTWSMAFPSTYDSHAGKCTAYASTDGGVFVNLHASGAGGCLTYSGPWARAESGLHVMHTFNIAGVSQAPCGGHACAAIYLPSGDNGTWGTTDGGTTWSSMGCCGDSGSAFVDPALPGQMVTARNGDRELYRSSALTPPSPSDRQGNFSPPSGTDGLPPNGGGPPSQPDFAQVMTLPGETPLPYGDYIGVESDPNSAFNDVIVRNRRAPNVLSWFPVSFYFGPSTVAAVGPSGGHTNPVLHVLTSDGHISTGQIDSSETVPSWTVIFAIGHAAVMFADPYDPNALYAADASDSTIKSTADGGAHWNPEPVLSAIATQGGTFRFVCAEYNVNAVNYTCSLNQVLFDRNDPKIRFAVLFPGGLAFSRDAGAHWIPLVEAIGPIDRPYSVFYDSAVNPQTGTPSLYVGLLGKSIIRVDAPFPTLESVSFDFTSPVDAQGRSLGPARVQAFLDDTGASIPLHLGADNHFRGSLLFDSARVPVVHYHFIADGQSTPLFGHTLTPGELASGLVAITYDEFPAVTSVSPAIGRDGGGTYIALTGTYFDSSTSLSFNSVSSNAEWPAAYIQCGNSIINACVFSPAGSGTVDIIATVNGLSSKPHPGDRFTYAVYPSILSLSPSTGLATGGTLVQITGQNFSLFPLVNFGPSLATVKACAETSNTGLWVCGVSSPPGTGSVDVTVTVNGLTSPSSAADQFGYIPVVEKVSPQVGPQSGGTSVLVQGAGFLSPFPPFTTITFGPNLSPSVGCTGAASCAAMSPTGSGTVDVRVSAGGLTSAPSSADQFTYQPVGHPVGWTQWYLTPNPSLRVGPLMAYDSMRGVVLSVGNKAIKGPFETWTWAGSGTNWIMQSPAVSPSAPGTALVFNQADGTAMMFGDRSGGNTTWLWNGSNWAIAKPANAPPGRLGESMVFDASHGKIVLFGGCATVSCTSGLADTWTWDGTNWTQMHPATSPTPRWNSSMAFDATRGAVVLFGGQSGNGRLGDTWIWNGSNWTQEHPSASPEPRSGAGLSYYAPSGELVLFGGVTSTSAVTDTWTWNGTTWTQLATAGPPELPVGMVYDEALQLVVLIGVGDGSTWTWGK